jgi:NAD(P)-dependent dehydrogenase (short-subunit alcohol dehydrogenase family)
MSSRQLAARRHIDGIVNNVGLVRPQPLGQVALRDLADVLDLNLRPALQTVQAALPAMRAAQFGRIVNVSSLTVLGVTQRTSYAAAKAALISFKRTWALELATSGITVNALAPGPTETELFRANNPAGSASEARFLGIVPMNRFARPREIAASRRVTGSWGCAMRQVSPHAGAGDRDTSVRKLFVNHH